MIHVAKNYDDIPDALRSKRVKKWEEEFMRGKVPERRSVEVILRSIRQILVKLYHGKCAYCETTVDPFGYLIISHYRPRSLYYWLIYEWSNLLPICPRCNTAQGRKFPLEDNNDRVTVPQEDRRQWLANSGTFLAEKPLLLNPELDEPGNHLSFYPDGRIYGLTERGEKTIEIYQLNRNALLLGRKKKIEKFRYALASVLEKMISLQVGKDDPSILELAFQFFFKELLESGKAESEFALMGRCMVRGFDKFFIEPLGERPKLRKLLLRAKNHFLSGELDKIGQAARGMPSEAARTPRPVTAAVDTLEITNIKCFDRVKLLMNGQSTLILGTNGRGKSTILQLLALGLSELERPPSYGDWYKVTKMDREKASFKIKLVTPDGPLRLAFSIEENDTVKCIKNAAAYQRFKDSLLVLAYGHGRNISDQPAAPHKKFEGIASLFGNTGYLKNIKDSTVYSYVSAGFPEIKDLVNKIFALAETEHAVELDNFETHGFYFKTPTAPSGGVPLEAMSDGFKSTFVLLFDLIIRAWEKGADMKRPENIAGIIMIDEIDLHLHPSWQRTFLPTLLKVFPNIQFIVTSHSPFIVQSMNTNDIIILSIEEEGVTARRVELDGKPYGHEIEKIIKEILGEELKIPEISEQLFQQLKDFEKAVKKGDKEKATSLYREIKAAIPADSGFTEYVEIMSAGLITEDVGDKR